MGLSPFGQTRAPAKAYAAATAGKATVTTTGNGEISAQVSVDGVEFVTEATLDQENGGTLYIKYVEAGYGIASVTDTGAALDPVKVDNSLEAHDYQYTLEYTKDEAAEGIVVAVTASDKFAVTYTPTTGTGITFDKSADVKPGATVTATVATTADYKTTAIKVTDAYGAAIATTPAAYSEDGEYTFAMPAGAATVTAENMAPSKLTLSAFSDAGTASVKATGETSEAKVTADGSEAVEGSFLEGETVTVAVTAKPGYTVSAPTVAIADLTDGTAASANDYEGTFVMPGTSATITAAASSAHTVTVDATATGVASVAVTGSVTSAITPDTTAVTPGETVTVMTAAATGYAPAAPTVATVAENTTVPTTKVADNIYTFTMPDESVTVTGAAVNPLDGAVYTVVVDTVTGGTLSIPEGVTEVNDGGKIKVTAKPDAGYSLGGVTYSDGKTPSAAGVVAMTEGEAAGTYEGTITFDPAAVATGTEVHISATFTAAEHNLAVDTLDASKGCQALDVVPAADKASYKQVVKVNAEPVAGWATKKVTYTYKGADGKDKTEEAKAVGASISGYTHTFEMPDADAKVSAEFEKVNYTIATKQSKGGTVRVNVHPATATETATPVTQAVAQVGATIDVTVTPDEGYTATAPTAKWDNGGTNGTITLTAPTAPATAYTGSFAVNTATIDGIVDGTVTVSAAFTPNASTLTLTTEGDDYAAVDAAYDAKMIDTIESGNEVAYGKRVYLKVANDTAMSTLKSVLYTVDGGVEKLAASAYTPAADETANYYIDMPDGAVALTATFETATYRVTLPASTKGLKVTANGSEDLSAVAVGDTITIAALNGFSIGTVPSYAKTGDSTTTGSFNLDAGVYVAQMPAYPITITAAATEANPSTIPGDNWTVTVDDLTFNGYDQMGSLLTSTLAPIKVYAKNATTGNQVLVDAGTYVVTFWKDAAAKTTTATEIRDVTTSSNKYYVKVTGTDPTQKDASGNVTHEGNAGVFAVKEIKVNPASLADVVFNKTDGVPAETDKKLALSYIYDGKQHEVPWVTEAPDSGDYILPVLYSANATTDGVATYYPLVLDEDFTADVKSWNEPKAYTLTMSPKAGGNFDSKTNTGATITVNKGLFVTEMSGVDPNLKVKAQGATGDSAKEEVTSAAVTLANKVPYGQASKPFSVFYGDTELPETAYTVTYEGTGATTYAASQTAPADKGTYKATVVAGSYQLFDLTSAIGKARNTITVNYEIAEGDLSKAAASVTFANGKYLGGAAVEPAASGVKFLDSKGAQVAIESEDFAYASYSIWTSDDEEDENYKNAGTAALTADGKPAGAGDYKVEVKGAGNYTAAKTVSGKFTVDPAASVKQGTAVGDLVTVELKDAEYNGSDQAADFNPELKVITEVSDTTGKITKTQTIEQSYTDYNTKKAAKNFEVTYKQNGEEVEFKELGTYDVEIAFSGNLKGSAPITGTVEMKQGKISSVLSDMTVNSDAVYSGNETLAKVEGFTLKADGTTVDPAGYDYELSYIDGSGKACTPLAAGSYLVTATFSGNYGGTIVQSFTVAPLNLADASQYVVQFEQADGTFDEVYSTTLPASGKAEPKFRVALNDKKQYTETPTIVTDKAYTFTYANSDNATKSGKASVNLTPAAGYTSNVTGTGKAEYTIADESFEGIHAAIELDKSSVAFGKDATFKLKVKSDNGYLVYNGGKGFAVKVRNADGEDLAPAIAPDGSGTELTVTSDKIAKAGDYTVIVTTGTGGQYAGVLKATFTVEKASIAKNTDYAVVLYTYGTDAPQGFYDPWKVPYAASKDGITFNTDSSKFDGTAADTFLGIVDLAKGKADGTFAANLAAGAFLVPDTDFTVEFADNKAAGTAKITFTGKGDYDGTRDKGFTIEKGTFADPGSDAAKKAGVNGYVVVWDKAARDGSLALDYTGAALEPAFKVYLADEDGNATDDLFKDTFETAWIDNTDVYYENNAATTPSAHAYVVLTASGNYTGDIRASFTINPVAFSKVAFDKPADAKYTGETVNPAIAGKFAGNDIAAGDKTFTVSYPEKSVNAGDYEATVTPAFHGNFAAADPVKVPYTIAKADSAVTVAGKTVTYNGKAVTVEAKATGSTKAPVVKYYSDEKATLELAAAPVNAGTYYAKATVEADDNHAAAESAVVKVVINRAASSVKVSDVKATYSGKAVTAAATKTGSSATPVVKYFSDKAATKAISAPVNAGTYYAKATLAADANYAAAESGVATISIAKAANPVKVKAAKKAYKAKAAKKTVFKAKKAFKVTGNKGGKVTYKKANKAGGKKITVSKKGKVTVKKGLKAGAYKVKVKATAKANKNYNKATKSVTLKVKVAKAKK